MFNAIRKPALALFALTFTLAGAHVAHAKTFTDYVETLEAHLESQERMDIETANAAIIAWACYEDTAQVSGVKFEACCAEAAQYFVNKKLNLNFYGLGSLMRQQVEILLDEQSLPADAFWAEFGVLPQSAARCANAMVKYRKASGFWETLTGEDELNTACKISNYASTFSAKYDILIPKK